MKKIAKAACVLVVFCMTAIGQFKSQPEVTSSTTESLIRPDGGGLMFGWFDPSRLTVHNSYSLSYTTSGSRAYSLGALTSSLGYQISNPLSVAFDVSLLHSPYSNLGGDFAKSISGVYLSRAELDYRPSKNTLLQIQFRQLPAMYWYNSIDRLGFMPSYSGSLEEEETH
jgi:hypothetical protein